jgi:acyl dehydratase
MNQHPLHIDENYAAGTQHRRRLVAGPLVISLVIGISQADVGGRAVETLDHSNVRHPGPLFHGDTIYAESSVVMREELPNERRAVTVSTHGPNPREETILMLQRKMVPKRTDEEVPCES